MKAAFMFVLLLAAPVGAQILQPSCGSSTLFNGSGCGATLYLPNSTMYSGIAYGAGRFQMTASDMFLFHQDVITVGDRPIGYSFDGTGLGLSLLGISLEHKTEDSSLTLFVGATGQAFSTPFILTAVQPRNFGAGVFLKRKWHGAKLYSLEVVNDGKYSAAQGIDFQWRQNLRISGSGGTLNSQPFASGTITYRPSNDWNFYASHQSIFLPYKATGNSVGGSFSDGRFTVQASANESDSQGKTLTGENVGFGAKIGFVQTQLAWYRSGNRTLTSEGATETFFWHHLTLTENVNQSGGQNSYAFGGGFTWANRLTVSVNHSIVFLLNGEGFQSVTGISLSMRLHDATLNFQTVTTPLGQTLYSVYGTDYVQVGSWSPGATVHAPPMGKEEYSGRVVDSDGQPVSGAAVQVGRVIAFTNDAGYFSVRGRKAQPLPIAVLPAVFAAPGNWEVISCPATIQAQSVQSASLIIVVKRK